MKKFFLYLRLHWPFFIILFFLFPIPLGLLFKYFPKDTQNLHFFFFVLLLTLRFVYFNEQKFKFKIKKRVRTELEFELKKSPSISQINSRLDDYINGKDLIFGLIGLLLLMTTIGFNKL